MQQLIEDYSKFSVKEISEFSTKQVLPLKFAAVLRVREPQRTALIKAIADEPMWRTKIYTADGQAAKVKVGENTTRNQRAAKVYTIPPRMETDFRFAMTLLHDANRKLQFRNLVSLKPGATCRDYFREEGCEYDEPQPAVDASALAPPKIAELTPRELAELKAHLTTKDGALREANKREQALQAELDDLRAQQAHGLKPKK